VRMWIVIALAGCTHAGGFPCTSNEQCTSNHTTGVCDMGFCAFPDSTCGSGLRYEPNAGDNLGGTCTTPPPAACGDFGTACCDSEPQCGVGAFCDSNHMCSSCLDKVALGRRFSCVLKTDHSVWCVGENASGQLGNGAAGPASPEAKQVRDNTFSTINDATAVSAGREHACAIRAGGAVWCWGANENGQLGNGVTIATPPPQPSPFAARVVKTGNVPLMDVVAIATGDHHSCAIDGTGAVWCWGMNSSGQLGDGCLMPPPPAVCPCAACPAARATAAQVAVAPAGAAFTGAVDIMTGERHTCVHKTGDALWCWGNNGGALLDTTGANKLNPINIGTVAKVATGNWHSCMINADTTVTCGGWNGHARIGIGTGTGFSGGNTMPTQVLTAAMGTPFTGAMQVAAGGVSCVITADTHAWCWSDDLYGQTGTGQSVTVPAEVRFADGTPLSGVDSLVVGYAHVCAKMMSGGYLCWGRNNQGELGDGSFVNYGFPAPYGVTCP